MCARIHGGRKLYVSLNSLGDLVYFERDPVDIVREMAAHNLRVGNGPPSDHTYLSLVTDELYSAPSRAPKRSSHTMAARNESRDRVLSMLNVEPKEFDRRLALNSRTPLQRATHSVEPDPVDYENRVNTVLADLSRVGREIQLAKLGDNGFDYASLASELTSARDKIDAMLD